MRVVMQTLYAGPLGIRKVGSVHDVSNEEAVALVEGHYATVDAKDRPAYDKLAAKKLVPEKK